MGQVTDAYEANEISFRYGDKTAVGLHKSAAPPVSWLSLAGTLLLWDDVLLDRLLPCHWTGIHLALWGSRFRNQPNDTRNCCSTGRSTMTTPEQRRRMAAAIVNFEARRDSKRHLMVYKLPEGDGGGRYEVAGINERYNKDTVDVLVSLIDQRRFDEAKALAADFIAQDTDRAASWTSVPALEFYLRDSVFNRGAGGAARILQRALAIADDGVVGAKTRAAMASADQNRSGRNSCRTNK